MIAVINLKELCDDIETKTLILDFVEKLINRIKNRQ
jgi:hypothetical protein